MKTFNANLKNELRKLRSHKKYYVFLILEIVIVLAAGLIAVAVAKRAAEYGITAAVVTRGLSMTMLGAFIQVYIPLIVFMAACDLFPGEISAGTSRAVLMRPVSRGKIYFSKAAAVFIVALVYLMTLFVLTTVVEIATAGSAKGELMAFISYFLDVMPMAVFVLFACMVCQFSQSPSLSIILCVIIYIALNALGTVVPVAGSMLFTGYLMWHTLWVGIIIPLGALLSKMGILIGYALVMGGLGYYLYERREA